MMAKALVIGAALLTLACGERRMSRENAAADSLAAVAKADSLAAAIVDTTLPTMPQIPRGRRGYLAATAVGALDFTKEWKARAGRCAQPAMILVIAEEDSSGASVLLNLPPSGDLLGTYPVKLADSTGVPAPPAAQLGFQFFQRTGASAYQAAAGNVELTALDARRASGRFEVTVRHITSNERARIAGVFDGVDVEPLPLDWCARADSAQGALQPGG
jgi:hypothetical protein